MAVVDTPSTTSVVEPEAGRRFTDLGREDVSIAGGTGAELGELTPPSPLDTVLVGDAMHAGVVVCVPRAPLAEVARIMASSRIHAVLVWGDEEDDSEGIWGIVSDLDLVTAAAAGHAHARSAVAAAETEVVTVGRGETLRAAAELMKRHGARHLIVVTEGRVRPVGILSTLDIAKALAQAS